MSVRVRFAPSPTGYLHVGGARTALFNYLFAKKHGGTFILRVEDTDLARSTEESMRMQFADLKWLGLDWDEGPHPETLKTMGEYGPYRQSERSALYVEHAMQLLERGLAYYDFRTDAELEAAKAKAIARGEAHQVPRPDAIVSLGDARARIAKGETAAVRFWLKDDRDYHFTDLVRGDVTFPKGMLGDFVILRSNGQPVYNFCNVIDDALMKITHVFRAEEHLSNTLRQLILYSAFSYAPPQFGHLSLILGTDRQKLSKRHGATSCNEFREAGFLPEALNNFIALLGWSSPEGQEILSLSEMIHQFGVERLNAAPAVFDDVKVKWMNATYLRALPHTTIWEMITPFLDAANLKFFTTPEWIDRSVALLKTSMETLKDAVELFRPLAANQFKVYEESQEVLSWEPVRAVFNEWISILKSSAQFLSTDDFLAAQEKIKVATGAKGKFLFMPIRVAIIGKPNGAELKDLVPLIARDVLIQRAEQCLMQLK